MTPDERRAFLMAPIRVGWFGRNIVSPQGGRAGCQVAAGTSQQEADDWEPCLNRRYIQVGKQSRAKAQVE